MAGGKLSFWGIVINSLVAFFLCVFVLIMAALLVYGIVHGESDISSELTMEYTAPVGKVFFRS